MNANEPLEDGSGRVRERRLRTPRTLAPDPFLLDGLRSIPAIRGREGDLELIERVANPYSSSCPSEIVRLRIGNEDLPPLFCKYAGSEPTGRAHRRGIDYESRVYGDLLMPLGTTVPRYFGTWSVPSSGNLACMVVEALTNAVPVKQIYPARISAAAGWLGKFHRTISPLSGKPETAFLDNYDKPHFSYWMDLAQSQAVDHGLALPWLRDLANRFEDAVEALTADQTTVVHGEYYPMNILASHYSIHPVDWESAGIGPGEIDLASLIMGWPTDVVDACIRAYVENRWSGEAPKDLRSRLDTARLYLCLRMLGNNRRETPGQRTPFFEYLHRTAVECGFQPGTPASGQSSDA